MMDKSQPIINYAVDCIRLFLSSKYPLSNIVRDFAHKKGLNANLRKSLQSICLDWSKESFLADNFLSSKIPYFSSQDQQTKLQTILMLVGKHEKSPTEWEDLKKHYQHFKDHLAGEKKYSLLLGEEFFKKVKESYQENYMEACENLLRPPSPSFFLSDHRINKEKLETYFKENSIEFSFHCDLPFAFTTKTFLKLEKLPLNLKNKIFPMDLASQTIASFITPQENDTVLELCSGKGMKTRILQENCSHIICVEKDPRRIQKAQKNLLPTKSNIEFLCQDVLVTDLPKNYFSWILLDAPCSGSGTVRRNPDLLHSWKKYFSQETLQLQQQLIDKSISLLKPGGKLIYVTCSVFPEENEQQIKKIFSSKKDLVKPATLPKTSIFKKKMYGYHSILSFSCVDGFFISCLEKNN